ncbi:MAG: hypothetical protein HYR55_20800 [Acidobacteria bacterium]|nr:hypothetical protein [Acidobacteriota bacterium]MBI3656895.1 hypothetical protein [Acidobacteriota bacterium]
MSLRDPGGTSGGLGEFFLGVIMAASGGYLITSQVQVTSAFGYWYGYNAFGLTLVPLLFGIFLLFYNGRSPLGWLLTVVGLAIIFIGIIANLHIYFVPTSLFNTIIMLVLLLGGLGLIARGVRAH